MSPEPRAAGVYRDIDYRNSTALQFCRDAAAQVKLHRLQDLSAAEPRSRRSSTQQDLVHIVVQDDAKGFKIRAAKSAGNLLGESIANTIRMTEPFPLHDLHIAVGRR